MLRKALLATVVLCLGLTATASAKPRKYCKVRHPGFYFQSLGKRHHGKFGVSHYRTFHYRVRPAYRIPYRVVPRGQRYQPGYRPHYRPRYYRRPLYPQLHPYRLKRPRVRLYFDF